MSNQVSDMTEEIWKVIPWSTHHLVSSFGRFRNLKRLGGQILKQHKDKGGYLRISFPFDGSHTKLAHRVVALVFIPNPENKPWVNHKNGIKTDNRLENLEWSTISENVNHAYATRLNWKHKGAKVHNSKFTNDQIYEIRKLSESGLMRVDLAKRFNVTPECISHIVLRKTWKHL